MDNATPSANSLAAVAPAAPGRAHRRGRLPEPRRADPAPARRRSARHAPAAFAHLLAALDLYHGGITEIVVVGDRPDLVAAVQHRYLPTAVLAWGERYDSPLWEGRDDGRAYVCRNYACQLPAETVASLATQLTP